MHPIPHDLVECIEVGQKLIETIQPETLRHSVEFLL